MNNGINSLNYFIDKIKLKVLKKKNIGRKFDFLSFPPSSKSFWISLFFLFPIEYPGQLLKKDIYFEAYLTKEWSGVDMEENRSELKIQIKINNFNSRIFLCL